MPIQKSITKDEYGSHIWVLLNDASSEAKSKKTHLQIDCKAKMHTIESEHKFSEENANCKLLFTENYGTNEIYSWKN